MKAVELCEVGMPTVYNADDLLDFWFKGSVNKIGHLHVSVRAGINLGLHVSGSWFPIAPFNYIYDQNQSLGRENYCHS